MKNGEVGVFKVVLYTILGSHQKPIYIIGKLINISEEAAEKNRLIIKAQVDGLTGVYNKETINKLIDQAMKDEATLGINTFILIDCDNFKNINDTHGHLAGDQVLVLVSHALKKNFRQTDIIGRVGGDEFCVYMTNVPNPGFISSKCEDLIKDIQSNKSTFNLALSIGVTMIDNEKSFNEVFKKADDALYLAKDYEQSKIVFSNDNEA